MHKLADTPSCEESARIHRMEPSAPPVQERIARRLRLLRDWTSEGVPPEYVGSIPHSLRMLAKWDEASLGIVPIASPNDISRSHAIWGREITEMLVLLGTLKARYPKEFSRRVKPSRLSAPLPLLEGNEAAWKLAVEQWHGERDAALTARSEADQYRSECERLRSRLAARDKEVQELQRALAKASGWGSRP